MRQDLNEPERLVAKAGALIDPPQASSPYGRLTLFIRRGIHVTPIRVIDGGRCFHLPSNNEERSLFQIIRIKAEGAWVVRFLLERQHADEISACQILAAWAAWIFRDAGIRASSFVLRKSLSAIHIAQGHLASVVFKEIVGLLRFRELDFCVTDVLDRAPLPGFSSEERMTVQYFELYDLAYDRQIFTCRQALPLSCLNQIATEASNDDSGAVLAEEGRAD